MNYLLFWLIAVFSLSSHELTFFYPKDCTTGGLSKQFFELLINQFNVTTFVETGTFLGETAGTASLYFNKVHTIEIAPHLYEHTQAIFKNNSSVATYLGDSVHLLPAIIKSIKDKNEKACFWLDGHYSAGITSKGEFGDTPICEELDAIRFGDLTDAVIIIDDVRAFHKVDNITEEHIKYGLTNYPNISEIKEQIKAINPDYKFIIFGDMAIAFIDSENKTSVSSVLKALTTLRLFDGKNYTNQKIEKAIEAIKIASGEEKEAIAELFNTFKNDLDHNLGAHIWLWYGLSIQEKDPNQARTIFEKCLVHLPELGFIKNLSLLNENKLLKSKSANGI